MRRARSALGLLALVQTLLCPAPARAGQAPPPVLSSQASPPTGARSEPAQMSGFALQVGDLPPGIVAVRVIRESFQTNVPGQTVLLRVGTSGRVLGATTNSDGRAQFDGLQVGDSVRVRAVVGSEVLESQQFDVPAQGGVRMVLVAGVGAAVASPADAWPPAAASSQSVPIPPQSVSATPPATQPSASAAPPTPAPAPAQTTTGMSGVGIAAGIGAILLVVAVLFGRRRPRVAAGPRPEVDAGPVVRGAATTAGIADRATTLRDTRDAIFEDLVRLEKRARAGSANDAAHAARREALIAELLALDVSIDELPAS